MPQSCKGCRKGQTLSNDLVISLTVFMAIILLCLYIWGTTNEQIGNSRLSSSIEQATLFASDSLVQTQGVPSDWEYYPLNSTQSIGIASERNVLSAQKLAALQAYNTPLTNATQYARVKEILGVGNLGFRFDVETGNSTPYSFGEAAPGSFNNTTIIGYVVERPVVYNNTASTLIVQAWAVKYG
ncbi:MAG TPA: hypothetical protein PLO51_00290 [Candidatus Micrarchaeota archaeon]|nr:hypothetical protein [Candidatus Micrarchaeota archaeon]